MSEPLPCPVCESKPEVTCFNVNPMFGGGLGYEVSCPTCHLSTGNVWRTEDDAIGEWNAEFDEFGDGMTESEDE